jgi:hypothetical protein
MGTTDDVHFKFDGGTLECDFPNLIGTTNDVHFELDGGMFECDDMVVGSYP